MIHSMTGFGKAEGMVGNKKVSLQIRSLNSKQADVTVKVPSVFKEVELDIRKQVADALLRGKIEVYLSFEATEKETIHHIDEALFETYFNQFSQLKSKYNIDGSDLVQAVMNMPEIITSSETTAETSFEGLNELVSEAINEIESFRKDEGGTLELDLKSNIDKIAELLTEALKFEDERTATVRARIAGNIEEAELKDKMDSDRFEQEMIYYMEKYDISEEKVRLKSHCDYFISTMEQEVGQGKKLGFISQEIGREVNTLGSKANHAQMQKLVVQMKDHLEKIKEQVLNVL